MWKGKISWSDLGSSQDFLGFQTQTIFQLEEELATVCVREYDLIKHWESKIISGLLPLQWVLEVRQHNVSDYLPRHLTVNIPERKMLRKEERETLLECELCKKYLMELTARYSADLNKLAALKSKKLCLFIVGKDVVISYFHCLENHRKKNNYKKKNL